MMKELKIHFLNTIWSDAIILEYNNHYGFIDTGSKFYYPMIDKHLKDYNIKALEFIVVTHFHNDHYGNTANLLNNFPVKNLYIKEYHGLDGSTSSGTQSNEEYIKNEFNNYYEILDAAQNNNTKIIFLDKLNCNETTIKLDNLEIELYDIAGRLYEMFSNPESKFYQQKLFNENFDSLGVFIRHLDHNIFLGADVTCSKTDIPELKALSIKMINRIYQKHNIDKIDLYKSCHHGGTGTNTLELCNLLKPSYTVITNTDRWLNGYETHKFLRESNPDAIILQTDYQKYIFSIKDTISYKTINEESLFITLKKD